MPHTPKQTDFILIGVDGGATETKANAVACDDFDHPTSFVLRAEAAARAYDRLPDFVPLPLTDQLAQRDAGPLKLTAPEHAQGTLWVASTAEAVADVAGQCGARRVLVGIGMPGLKTADGRGNCVVNNGPRIPDYLNQFEQRLSELKVELVVPVAALGSDADYCGVGELYAADGLFRDVPNAYYLGGGTGLAEALKLHGRLVTFDEACGWIQKAWQIPSALGPTFEKLVSAKSMNDGYARLVGSSPSGAPRFPEADAADGQPPAVAWMDTVALTLAELIFERLDTIKNGRRETAHRGDAYRALTPAHEFRGTSLDRVVIGQRVGQIYADPRYGPVFGAKLDSYLAAYTAASGDAEMISRYLVDDPLESGRAGSARHLPTRDDTVGSAPQTRHMPAGDDAVASVGQTDPPRLKPGFVCASKLRAAPALGAAVAAVQALRQR
ncbi:MAG: hypothetical protein V2A79_02850 [Planctomycetota bacterium]